GCEGKKRNRRPTCLSPRPRPVYIHPEMNLRIAGILGLATLLIQVAPIPSCSAQAMTMPCCTPTSDCGRPSPATAFSSAPCCRLDAPVDRQVGADRPEAMPRPAPAQVVAAAPAQGPEAPHDLFASVEAALSPPGPSSVPLYLKLSSFLC